MKSGSLVLAVIAFVSMPAMAALPSGVARAFHEAGIPLDHVAVLVREAGAPGPLFAHNADRPMNPASVMKLVTTYAALDLLGSDYRWKTEAYLQGRFNAKTGTLTGDLVLKGYGDPKITVEHWQSFMASLRTRGLKRVTGDLVLDRSFFKLPEHDAAKFDNDPFRPYNVGPDALLVNFKALRFAFVPDPVRGTVDVRIEPPLPGIALDAKPQLAGGDCGDWRTMLAANYIDRGATATVRFSGVYGAGCGERDWYVALLDHQHYVHGMFGMYFEQAGGKFSGRVREGRAPRNTAPFAVLESPPLYDIMRDVNKLSNNVMARQVFLTLATVRHPPPATPALATDVVHRWLKDRKITIAGLVLENGSGLSRHERMTARGLAHLLAHADASSVREEFTSSLAVAAMDGTVERRFQNGTVAGQALLKTGSLDGVRALAGYVIDADGRRFLVVSLINDPNAARGSVAIDYLIQWVYHEASHWDPALRR